MSGANPPQQSGWQVGKTAASIAFVNEAEAGGPFAMSDREWQLLDAMVKRLKNGSESLTDFQTVSNWLDRLQNHYP